MVEEIFSIDQTLCVDPPCFVRKVDRRGHWMDDAATIAGNVFRAEPDGNSLSVYLVNSATDLARVAVALNANRKSGSRTEPLMLVAIMASELGGIQVVQTSGMTKCNWANHLHRDLVVTNASQVARLADALVDAGRKLKKFTKPNMQHALEAATKDGCHATSDDSVCCVCEDDLPSTRSLSWLRWVGQLIVDKFRVIRHFAVSRLNGCTPA